MLTIEAVLERLKEVEALEDHWLARCPLHEASGTPSLGIRIGGGGVILMHCTQGCSVFDVLDSIGLTCGDLIPDARSSEEVAREVMRLLRRELDLVARAAQDTSQGVILPPARRARLYTAARRIIQAARSV